MEPIRLATIGTSAIAEEFLGAVLTYSKSCASGQSSLIMGDRGVMEVDTIETFDHVRVRLPDGSTRTVFDRDRGAPMMSYEAEAFVRMIRGIRENPKICADHWRLMGQVTGVMEEIRRSAGILFAQDCYVS